MTPAQKAIETRRKHAEARKQKDRKMKEIQEKMIDTCLHVLDEASASSADKMRAVEILHDLSEKRWR